MKPELQNITKELLWKIIQLDEEVKKDCNNVISDCLVQIYDMEKPTNSDLKETYMNLPFDIILEALQHGFSDTPTRDSIYASIEKYKNVKK